MSTATRTARTLAAVLAAGLLAACGGDDDALVPEQPTPRPEVTVSQDPAPPGTPAAPPAPDELTEAQDGRVVSMAVGQEIPLRLSSSWEWQEPEVDPQGEAVVSLSPVDHLSDPGFREWLVTAAAPGTAELVSRGEPACGDPAACPPRELRLVVEVAG
jgi:hypothetical protein